MEYNPTISVFGVNWKKFPGQSFALYKNFLEIFNTQFIPLDITNRRMGATIEAAKELDFSKIDADFLFFNDSTSPFAFSQINDSTEDYFSGFLKIYQIDWPMITVEKKKIFNMTLLHNCLYVDVILISKYVLTSISERLRALYSPDVYQKIIDKMVVVPPSGIYKFDAVKYKKDFSKLSFVWNHRFTTVKNHKDYFEILSNLKKEYPGIPFEIYIMCDNVNKAKKNIPSTILSNCIFIDFIYDTDKYLKFYKDKINIGIGTSKLESFGICAIEHIKTGCCFINLKCNKSFSCIIGNDYTFNLNNCVDEISKCYNDEKYRNHNINYHFERYQQNVMSIETYKKMITDKLKKVFQKRVKKCQKTDLTKKAVSFIKEQKTVTKTELFKFINWNINTMKFYSILYYAMRNMGIGTHYANDDVYFVHKDNEFNPKKKTSINDIFLLDK